MKKHLLRRAVAILLSAATLWAVAAAAAAVPEGEAQTLALPRFDWSACALALLRFERGALLSGGTLSLPSELALRVTPLLLPGRGAEETDAAQPERTHEPSHAGTRGTEDPGGSPGPAPEPPSPETAPTRDNGVPSTTLRPTESTGYLAWRDVLIRNTSAAALSEADLDGGFSAVLTEGSPQVLIVHTHGCEAYTMPPGEEYEESDDHRTLDESCNVLRVGDEIARTLEAAGIGVVHDRTLHDYPSYSGAYDRSLATVERCMAQYPSIVYVLDVHRDAVEDSDGRQYKLLCAEEPGAAQLEFVIGSNGGGLSHDGWHDNLRLACAVQETLLARYPTLMRPIVVRNSRYNQQVCPGSLLLEVGTAGNSLDEALAAARLFAMGFAETIKTERDQPNG